MILLEVKDFGIRIKTFYGYTECEWIMKLPEEPCCELEFQDGSSLICSKLHMVFTDTWDIIYAKDSLKRKLQGINGLQTVESIKDKGLIDCYDVQVKGKTYYTNGILSHNSTISGIFLLHYINFNANKTVAILANKASTAKQILSRIKLAFQNLPKFLQQGVREWNKSSIELENGSRIIASSSSASNIRGDTINVLLLDECLEGSTKVTVKNENGQIFNITLEELYKLNK